MVIGNFNDESDPINKKGSALFNWVKAQLFNQKINQCNLLEMEAQGSRFTWKGAQIGSYPRVFEKLDRALCNIEWRVRFGNTFVQNLPCSFLYHHPIILHLFGEVHSKENRPFKFEAI